MSNIKFTNFAATTLASGINSVVTSLTVATGTGALFPTLVGAQYFYCVLADAATGTTSTKGAGRLAGGGGTGGAGNGSGAGC